MRVVHFVGYVPRAEFGYLIGDADEGHRGCVLVCQGAGAPHTRIAAVRPPGYTHAIGIDEPRLDEVPLGIDEIVEFFLCIIVLIEFGKFDSAPGAATVIRVHNGVTIGGENLPGPAVVRHPTI